MFRKNLGLLIAILLSAAMLWGCGSSSSGGTDVQPRGPADLQRVGSGTCKTCHSLAHNGTDPLVGQAEPNALSIIHDCEDCHGGGSAHRGLGPIPYPVPDVARCAVCHEEAVNNVVTAGTHEAKCADCHDPLQMALRKVAGNVACIQCHTSLTEAELKEQPFSNQITERFAGGKHVGSARAGNCAACHSHEGALLLFSQPGKVSSISQIEALADQFAGYAPASALNPKTCATCHEPHAGTLRGIGDVKETVTLASNLQWERTVYSAEFNLCTTCHQVSLETTWNPAGGYNNAGVIEYALADVYAKSADNQDPYTNKAIGYHTNSYQRRSFVDTHFAGDLYKKLYYYDVREGYYQAGDIAGKDEYVGVLYAAMNRFRNSQMSRVVPDGPDYDRLVAMYDEYVAAPDNIAITGYNVNPGSANACSACHDVHAANKLVVPFTSTLNGEKNFEANIAKAIAYGEGVGATHGNYMGNAFARNVNNASNGDMFANASCTPCHTGRDYVKMTVGAAKADLGAAAWNPVSCVSCHDTAQNAAPLTNPRVMPDGYVFSFPPTGSVLPTAAELGSSQICFECHRGRTPAGVDVSAMPVGPTNHYDVSYLHYSPTFAIYYGNEAKMVATYAGKTYRGKSTTHSADATRDIGGGLTHGVDGGALCLDCHDVHGGIRVSNPNIRNGRECATCHDSDATAWHNAGRIGPMPEGNKFDQRSAKADISNTAARLVDTIYAQLMATTNTGFNPGLTTFLTNLQAQTDVTQGKEMVKLRIKERTLPGGWPTKEIAHACASWKVFYYEDKASFAHNRNFARQIMFDAIESLGGDTVGIPTRPN